MINVVVYRSLLLAIINLTSFFIDCELKCCKQVVIAYTTYYVSSDTFCSGAF